MKVFISHSSTDKWIARRISQDLEALGVVTFLDEKDIKTGESIDTSIQEHLHESDELLMLLSPAALKSTWVLIEIGGAKALKKRLVPITIHVPANELPQVLSGGLARDLNDIDRYYGEVEERAKSESAPVAFDIERPATPRAKHDIKPARPWKPDVGDQVLINGTEPDRDTRAYALTGFRPPMRAYLGKLATVTEAVDDEGFRLVRLDIDPEWWWASEWLSDAGSAKSRLAALLQEIKGLQDHLDEPGPE